jgi:hypothetical protein
MIEGNVVMTRIATVAIIAIRAWRLVFLSDGPQPHVQIDQGDIFPFGVDRRGLWAFRQRSTIPEAFTGRVPQNGFHAAA